MEIRASRILPLYLLLSVRNALASPLSTLLKGALFHDPSVMAARTESASTRSKVEQVHSAHWPAVTVTGSKLLSRSHRYSYDYDSEDILPGIRDGMNILVSGAIEADVCRSEPETEYYYLKEKETGEETIRSFVPLYPGMPRGKQPIVMLEQSLPQYGTILNDLDIISARDTGRESKFVQIEARRLMVRQQINTRIKVLKTTLERFLTWITNPIIESDLENPFSRMTESRLLTGYT